MKLGKFFGLIVLSVALLSVTMMGVASATTLTGSGGTTLGVGTTFSAEAEGATTLHPPFGDIECEKSSLSSEMTNAGGSSSTPTWLVIVYSTGPCPGTVHILKFGILEIHSANPNGRITWTNLEMTVESFGFHCIFKTNGTEVGTLTGSATTGGNATLDLSATIPRTGGRSGAFCGSTAQWTGSLKFTSPSVINVD